MILKSIHTSINSSSLLFNNHHHVTKNIMINTIKPIGISTCFLSNNNNNKRFKSTTAKTSTTGDSALLSFKTIQPQSTINHSLVSEYTFAKTPTIYFIQDWYGIDEQLKSHGEHIANNVGAQVRIPHILKRHPDLQEKDLLNMTDKFRTHLVKKVIELIHFTKNHEEIPKIGLMGFGLGGALSLEVASKINPKYLSAVASFYGLPPPSVSIIQIPVSIPVQTHFGELDSLKSFSDIESAKRIEKQWEQAINKHGGPHATGFHHLEEHTFFYPKLGHGFMDDTKEAIERNVKYGYQGVFDREMSNLAWKRLFQFFTKHLKVI